MGWGEVGWGGSQGVGGGWWSVGGWGGSELSRQLVNASGHNRGLMGPSQAFIYNYSHPPPFFAVLMVKVVLIGLSSNTKRF